MAILIARASLMANLVISPQWWVLSRKDRVMRKHFIGKLIAGAALSTAALLVATPAVAQAADVFADPHTVRPGGTARLVVHCPSGTGHAKVFSPLFGDVILRREVDERFEEHVTVPFGTNFGTFELVGFCDGVEVARGIIVVSPHGGARGGGGATAGGPNTALAVAGVSMLVVAAAGGILLMRRRRTNGSAV